MRVISRKALREFWEANPEAEARLKTWFQRVKRARWTNSADVQGTFGAQAEHIAGNRYVIDVGGNRYRIVVAILFSAQKVYVRFVGTHADYDKIDAKTV